MGVPFSLIATWLGSRSGMLRRSTVIVTRGYRSRFTSVISMRGGADGGIVVVLLVVVVSSWAAAGKPTITNNSPTTSRAEADLRDITRRRTLRGGRMAPDRTGRRAA